MKRITISIILLCALAVMTLFITTISCKGGISGGSSGAPPKEPGHYIKAGRSFQKISDDRMLDSISREAPEGFAQKAILIPASCTTIEYACRLTPTQTRDALSGGFLAQHDFGSIFLHSAVTSPDPWGKIRIESGSSGWVIASDAEDRSQYKDGDTYILLIFKLPASPEGKYFLRLYGGSDDIALQRKK